MTTRDFANRKGISHSKVKKMAPYLVGAVKCPKCKCWIIPDNAKPIYIPDKRKYSKLAKNYCYLIDAIALEMDLHPEISCISPETCATIVRELREKELISLKVDKNSESLYHLDYIISLKLLNWNDKKSKEKSELIYKTVLAGFNAIAETANMIRTLAHGT